MILPSAVGACKAFQQHAQHGRVTTKSQFIEIDAVVGVTKLKCFAFLNSDKNSKVIVKKGNNSKFQKFLSSKENNNV